MEKTKKDKNETTSDKTESNSTITKEANTSKDESNLKAHLDANKKVESDIKSLVKDESTAKTTGIALTEKEVTKDDTLEKKVNTAKQYGHVVKNEVIEQALPSAITLIESVTEQAISEAANRSLTNRPLFSWNLPEDTAVFQFLPQQTPFQVIQSIPRFFKFTQLQNSVQDPNVQDRRIHPGLDNVPQIVESRNIFNELTMTVRVVPEVTINGHAVGDPNKIEQGAVVVQQVQSEYDQLQSYANLLESRLMYNLRVFNATDNILHQIPSKVTVNRTVGDTPLHSALSSMAFFENDYPHIYLSVFFSTTPWYVKELSDLFENAPIQLGEANTETWQNKKITARIRAVTDQFATAIANLQIARLKASQLNIQDYILRCRANMFPLDDVHVMSPYNERVTNLLYSPSDTEWQLVMALIICNRKVRDTLFNKIHELIMPTNRFTILSIDQVWNPQHAPVDNLSSQMYRTWLERMSVGDHHSPYQMVMFETFSSWFNFQVKMPPLPSDYATVIEMMGIIFFYKMFPQIAQCISNQLGYRLNQLLNAYLPRHHNTWQIEYGEVRFNKQRVPMDGRMITVQQSQQGYIYSIFDDISDRKGSVQASYFNFIRRMRQLCLPRTSQIHLERKQRARYPYYRKDYNAIASWEELVLGDLAGEYETDWSKEILEVITLVEGITQLRTPSGTQRDTLQRTTQTWMNTYYSNLRSIIKSSPMAIQVTMFKMQETLMNSFAFVHQRYNPLRPFNVPSELVLSPAKDETTAMGVPIQKSQVIDLDIFIAFRFLLTLEGDNKRNINLSTKGVPQSTDGLPQPQQNYKMIQGGLLDDLAMGLISPARRFGVAMQIMQWVTDPNVDNNPFVNIAKGFRYIMRMSNWVPLLERIFLEFGLNFRDYYIDAFAPTTGVFDGRSVLLQIRELNSQTQRPEVEPRDGELWGREIKYTDDWVRQHLSILTVPFLNDSSSILNTVHGIYVGRFLVDELTPLQRDIERGWTVVNVTERDSQNNVIGRNVWWPSIESKNGYTYALKVKIGNDYRTYKLPYDRRTNYINTMLSVIDFSEIPITHKPALAKAIHWGWLALKVSNIVVSVPITDMPRRDIDYSDEKTISEIEKLIMTPAGEIITQSMLTTTYATNYTSNVETISSYIQWVTTMEEADKNLHAAVLNSGPKKTEQTHLPRKEELELGQPLNDITLQSSLNMPKIQLDFVNWNNEYTAIGKELIQSHVKLEYVPAQPMPYQHFKY